jgi:ketosteroid isomerase-like protein
MVRVSLPVDVWEVEPARPARSWEERLALHAPWIGQLVFRLAERSRAGGRFRRRVLSRAVPLGFAATNRKDWDALYASFTPDTVVFFEFHPLRIGPDMRAEYRGREGMRESLEVWGAGFAEMRFEPHEIADMGGPRFAVRCDMVGRSESGIELRQENGYVFRLRNGLVESQSIFESWDEALAVLQAESRT